MKTLSDSRTRAIFWLLLLVGITAGTASLHAQRYLGGLSGTVADQTGAILPGAQVTAVEASTKFTTEVTSGADGAFSMPSLSPGTYSVSVTAKGFKTETRINIVLTAGQVVQLDFKLSPGSVTQSIQVVSETSSLIDTSSPTVATTLDMQAVVDLPNEGRNPYVLATLAPGVVDTASGGYFNGHASQYTNPYSGVAVQITAFGNGGHNRLTLDGIPNDAPERFSGSSYTNFVPSPEAVQEVKVEDGIFDAQIGHGNGVLTNTVIKSGTNSLHGAAYYVFENTYLDANTYDRNAAKQPRSNNQVNQTGLVMDGPVVLPKLYNGRNKTFFMFSFERYATHTPIPPSQSFSVFRVPTQAELGGDFSGLCPGGFNSAGFCTSSGGVQLFAPNSPVDANGNRTEYFMNNNIVASNFGTASYTCTSGTCTVSGQGAPVAGTSAISPTGAALATYIPGPNVSGSTAYSSASQSNYVPANDSYPATYPSFIGRFDFELGHNDKLSAIGFRSGLTQTYPMYNYPKGIGPNGYGYSVYRNNRGGSVDEVHQFSSSMVLDSRFGLIYHPFGLLYPGNSGFDLTKLSMSQTGLPYNTFPGVSFSSDHYVGLAPGAGGQISTSVLGSLDEILSKEWGRHSVRFGFQGEILRYNVQNPMSGFGNGSGTSGFAFDRRFTQSNSVLYGAGSAPATNGVTSGDPLASMLLGDFSSANYNDSIAYATQQIYMAPFVQDDWRVNNKLTLNLGFRYDYESPLTERFNRLISGFCITCVNPLQSSVTGLSLNGGLQFVTPSSRFPYPHDTHNLQPRLGAAYQVRPNTVVRAGFGIIFFDTIESPYSTGFSQSTSYNNYTTSAPLNSLTNPFPTGVVLPTGNTLGLKTGLGQGINFNDQTHVQPRAAEYTLNIQQMLPYNIALQVGYVGSRPTRLEVSKNINALPAVYYNQGAAEVTYLNNKVANPMAGQFASTYANNATLNASTIQQYLLLMPFPEFGSVTEQNSSIGSTPYNSLQIQASHPMTHHFAIQGNFTWDKLMIHNGYLNSGIDTHLESYEDNNSNVLANIFGTYELPRFAGGPYLERLTIGGWKLNGVLRMANGNLISAPGNVNIIGPTGVASRSYSHYINTCYENTSGVLVVAPGACSSTTDTPAYEQRLSYTTQSNGSYIPVRQTFHPLMDASLFKTFPIREAMSFEIRGEFFNVLNSPIFGTPSTSIGSSSFGVVSLTQVNDPRFGQLTARFNF